MCLLTYPTKTVLDDLKNGFVSTARSNNRVKRAAVLMLDRSAKLPNCLPAAIQLPLDDRRAFPPKRPAP